MIIGKQELFRDRRESTFKIFKRCNLEEITRFVETESRLMAKCLTRRGVVDVLVTY